ncbi:hypothetical protein D7X87_25315 [bacterium D16-54]|nr:hypothetical protein D7X87_25315 [bacterium D16-54]RKJ09438.1 hypothetical protein D7X65_25410 [bacterium D16-56]
MKRLDRDSFHWPDTPDELKKVTLKEIHWLCDGLSLEPKGAFRERHPKIAYKYTPHDRPGVYRLPRDGDKA